MKANARKMVYVWPEAYLFLPRSLVESDLGIKKEKTFWTHDSIRSHDVLVEVLHDMKHGLRDTVIINMTSLNFPWYYSQYLKTSGMPIGTNINNYNMEIHGR